MRYDFDDQIQVRYQHTDGENFDTWVSGDEVLSRLRSAENEERLIALSKLDIEVLRKFKEELPEVGTERAWSTLKEHAAKSVEDNIGGNAIGDSLADAVRGYDNEEDSDSRQWQLLLQENVFKSTVIELAWIQLEGSLPEDDTPVEYDDWV
jgi:hypothetical protein